MGFWLLLLTANAWGLLILIQGSLAESQERLQWLQKRALLCAWMAFVGAAIVVGMGGYVVYSAYANGWRLPSSLRTSGALAGQQAIDPRTFVSQMMKSILVALLLMPVPLTARVVVNRRLQKKA
jgi:hypothetical protein